VCIVGDVRQFYGNRSEDIQLIFRAKATAVSFYVNIRIVDSIPKLTRSNYREARENVIGFSYLVRSLVGMLWGQWEAAKREKGFLQKY